MKRQWIYYLLALALVIYFWVPMMLMLFEDKHEPEPDEITRTTKPSVTSRPLDDYNIIAERKLVGTPRKQSPASSEKMESILLEGIRIADKDLGLSLVGTVLVGEPKMNIAFINNRNTRHQQPYHEGDRIGEVLVKRIFWDSVIIETKRGEELLVMLFEGTAGGSWRSSSSSSLTDLEPTVSSGPLDLEPTVSSGPLHGGSSSSVDAATRDSGGSSSNVSDASRDGGVTAAGSGGSTLDGGVAITDSSDSLPSYRSYFDDSGSSSAENIESESSPSDSEPTVSSGPLY